MTRETIKEYILQVKSQDGTEALYNRWEPDILVEVINEIFNDHEAQLKAKDEEIAMLEKQSSDLFLSNLLDEKRQDAKARSIVAMLFWEWKKYLDKNDQRAEKAEQLFQQAYKMLKDNQ